MKVRYWVLGFFLSFIFPAISIATVTPGNFLNGIQRVLEDPQKKVLQGRDSTLVITSAKGDLSIGRDNRVKLHDPGTLDRIHQITKGFSITLGDSLGHAVSDNPQAPGAMRTILSDPNFKMMKTSNRFGFLSRHIPVQARPLELIGKGNKFIIHPDGKVEVKLFRPLVIGFGAPRQVPTRSARQN